MTSESCSPIASTLVQEDASFADLVEEFVDGLQDRLDQMNKAVASSDFEQLKRLAHQLKGAGGGHGYPALTNVSGDLEQSALAEQLEDCQRQLEALRSVVDRVVVS